ERLRRESLGGKPSPEAVTVASDGYEACDSVVANKVIDFAALNVRGAVIPRPGGGIESRISLTGPNRGPSREILRVGAHLERGNGVAPDLPCCLRLFQLFQKPGFLFGSKNRRGRLIFAEIRNFLIAEFDGCRRTAAIICVSGIEDF